MILFLDLDSRQILDSRQSPFRSLELKRRDTDLIELQFLRDRVVQELPTGASIRLGIKPSGDFDADFLASATFTKSGTGTSTKYLADINLNTTVLATAFTTAEEPESLPAMLEIEWASGSNISSSKTLPVTIANDVIRGDEGEPAELPLFYTSETSDFKATQAEAQTGTANDKWMSPLRVAESIAHRRGAANGLASLDANTQIPRAQLPSFEGNSDLLEDIESLSSEFWNRVQSSVTYSLSLNNPGDAAVIQFINISRGWAVLTGGVAADVIATLPVPAELSVNAGDIITLQHKGNFQGTLSVRHRTFSSNTWQPSTFTTVASGLGPATYTFRFTGTGWDRIIFA